MEQLQSTLASLERDNGAPALWQFSLQAMLQTLRTGHYNPM